MSKEDQVIVDAMVAAEDPSLAVWRRYAWAPIAIWALYAALAYINSL